MDELDVMLRKNKLDIMIIKLVQILKKIITQQKKKG